MKEWNFPFLWKGFLRSSKRRNFYIHSWPKFSRKTEALACARERERAFAWSANECLPGRTPAVPSRCAAPDLADVRLAHAAPGLAGTGAACAASTRTLHCAARAPLGRYTAPPAPRCTAPPSHGLTSAWSHPLGALFLGKDKEREGCWIFYLAPSYSYGG